MTLVVTVGLQSLHFSSAVAVVVVVVGLVDPEPEFSLSSRISMLEILDVQFLLQLLLDAEPVPKSGSALKLRKGIFPG